jgi:glycerol-3-phosphate dehydrogenase
MKNFSFLTRQENLKKLAEDEYDLLIIGGGVTGAGVARDASLRGLKVALVEANDFAFGTSSRSSKLVHGGIRYLENLDFKLVFEALAERSILFRIVPHLAHPLRFVIPLYKSSRVSMFKMGLGMILYDALALFKTPKMHQRLSASEVLNKYSLVQSKELIGAYEYSDGYMDDDRLVHETLRSANEEDAVMVNYVKVLNRFKNDDRQLINCVDQMNGKPLTIRAHHIVSTVGPWTDLVGSQLLIDKWKNILRPTKGIHLTFAKSRIHLDSAVVMAAEKSSRIVFAIPRHEMVIVGTTDTDFNDNPETVSVLPADVDYLLKITNQYFPGANLSENDIISSYAGVRPLVKDESDNEGKTSREHTILHDSSGITFVAGGKYTTYRKMAEQVTDQVLRFFKPEVQRDLKKCDTKKPLNVHTNIKSYQQSVSETESKILQHRLAVRYGSEYKAIMDLHGHHQSYWAIEAAQAIRTTMCLNLTDFYTRRVPLFLAEPDHGLSLIDKVALVFQQEMNLGPNQIEQQKSDLLNYIKKELSWRM